MTFTVAPCSVDAAKWAVEHWHYSRQLRGARKACYGVWQDGSFIGAIVFADGASSALGAPYGLVIGEVVELTRIALTSHHAPVSQILVEALRQFRASNRKARLIVSFADREQGHRGAIYQAANFIYTGLTATDFAYLVNGKRLHSRTVSWRMSTIADSGNSLDWFRAHIDPNTTKLIVPGKHRYVLPLDKAMRRQVTKLAQQPPSAAEVSMATFHPSGVARQVQTLQAAQPTQVT